MVMKKAMLSAFILLMPAFLWAQDESFGQNKVHYRSYDWQYIQTHNFDIFYEAGQDSVAYFAADALESAYVIISKELDHELTSRVPVIIYSSPNDFQQTNVTTDLIGEGIGGFTEAFKTRVVVPFDGSYEDFRHVLHHELTHAVTFNLLYNNAIGSLISRNALFRQPLWLAEGYAEYSSRLGWTYEADMSVRDAVIEGYLPDIPNLFGLLNYRAGHALMIYISETYGEQKIAEINHKGKMLLDIDRAVDAALGLKLDKMSKDWHRELKRIYWPELAKRQSIEELGKMITDHEKDGSIVNMNPQWSPKGDRIAITSDRGSPQDGYSDRFTDIYLVSAIDGSQLDKLVSAEKTGDLESLHSYYSGISWSPDGSKLVFVAKSNGVDALFFVDEETRDIYKKFKPGLMALKSPSWSPQGDKIVVTGQENETSDLYIYDLNTGSFTNLTNDKYDDIDADFSPDGSRLAFSSDRPAVFPNFDTSFSYGQYNIFTYNLTTNEITALTDDDTKSSDPEFSPDGKMLAYVSYRNGISNVYIRNLETGDDFPVTNTISGVFSPSWSPEGDKIVVSVYNYYGFDIAVVKGLKPLSETGELEPTIFRATGRLYPDKEPLLTEGEGEPEDSTGDEEKEDYSQFIFSAGQEMIQEKTDSLAQDTTAVKELVEEKVDTLEYRESDGTYKKKDYTPKFSPELVAGGFSYDNFYGLTGQTYFSLSDMMGNHHFYIYTDVVNSIDETNIQLYYDYLAKRMNYAVGIFHYKYWYYDEYYDYYFADRNYGVVGIASYPFSKFKRLEFSLMQLTIDREYDVDVDVPNSVSNLTAATLSYVNDGVIWGIVGPVYGQRYKLTVEKAAKIFDSGYSYASVEFDYRRYFHFGKEYNFAVRFAGGASYGADARRYYLGGTSYWIDPSQSTDDIYSERDIYINKLVVPLRGYKYFEFSGKKYALLNMELRFPFVDYLKIRYPLAMTLTQIRGSLFWDTGAAFNIFKDFEFFDKEKGFPTLGTPRSGFGFSIQSNLGIFVLRYDLAWKTDFFKANGHPVYYFSLGATY